MSDDIKNRAISPLSSDLLRVKQGIDGSELVKKIENTTALYTPKYQNFPITNYNAENNKVLKEIDEKLEVQISKQDIQISQQEVLISKQDIIINALVNNLKSVNHTLDLILISIGANSQKTQEGIERNSKLLLELQQILLEEQFNKDSGKLKKFLQDHGLEAFSAVLQIISLSLGGGA